SRRRHTISKRDWSSDVCSSDLTDFIILFTSALHHHLLHSLVTICVCFFTFTSFTVYLTPTQRCPSPARTVRVVAPTTTTTPVSRDRKSVVEGKSGEARGGRQE